MQAASTSARILLIASLALGVGCSQSSSQPVAESAAAAPFLLTQEPAGGVTFAQAKEAAASGQPVVLTGRIGVSGYEAWADGMAAFLMTDASEAAYAGHGGPNHDPDKCPFCKRKQQSLRAIVQFENETGAVLPIDARKLLGVAENQVVVVRGRPSLDELGNIVVAAEGIYIRR